MQRALGAIQGAAQLLTVLASATGPWLLAKCGSTPLMFSLAPAIALLGVFCLVAPMPPPPGPDPERMARTS